MRKHTLLFLLLFAGISSSAFAQLYVFSGVHKSYVRNEVLTNASPIYSWHVGVGVNAYRNPNFKKMAINTEFTLIQKGYNQHLGNEKFEFRFTYLTLQPTIEYKAFPFLCVKGGVNLAFLLETNKTEGKQTYEIIDFGLVGSLGFFENKRISFYTQVVYGVSPMLKYYNIDAMGNFNGKIKDLKNTCFMVGLRFNINEKASIFK